MDEEGDDQQLFFHFCSLAIDSRFMVHGDEGIIFFLPQAVNKSTCIMMSFLYSCHRSLISHP